MSGSTHQAPSLLSMMFGLKWPVSRKLYITVGVTLMALKYGLDATAVYIATGEFMNPIRFVMPLWSQRMPEPAASFSAVVDVDFALVAMALWALVFMWIGVSMSIRRAVDGGLSGWVGLLFMLPVLNLLVMLGLALVPSSEKGEWSEPVLGPYREPDAQQEIDANMPRELRGAMLGTVIGIGIGLSMTAVSVYALGNYGAALFFFTPFLMGAIGSYIFNRKRRQSASRTVLVSVGSVTITGMSLILLALEGAICILMAAPMAFFIAALGALLGRALAAQGHAMGHAAVAALMLPPLAGAEAALVELPVHEVITTVEVDVPPAKVWPNVIGFSELPQPVRKIFDLGIAYPMRAHIDGSGVGAVRYCEFSTGPFVEPITRWEPPNRLSFEVASQPPAMKEWSPWANVYPPHLDASIRSKRGEFRLIALPGGRTRLEGSTWYTLRMAPAGYWRFWSDMMMHSIHHRVLAHVKNLSEGS